MYTRHMIKKITFALLFAIPSLSFAVDLDGYYITAKGGASKSMDTGVTSFTNLGDVFSFEDNDLSRGTAFGFSVGKYLTDNFRLEIEALRRTGYDFKGISPDAQDVTADIQTTSLFINGFYDFQPFTIGDTPVTPYFGGGVGISRNKMGTATAPSEFDVSYVGDNKINQFAYKLSAGTLFSLTEQLSLDVNYQYVNLGAFKGGTSQYTVSAFGEGPQVDLQRGINGGNIKAQELMVGLQYKF